MSDNKAVKTQQDLNKQLLDNIHSPDRQEILDMLAEGADINAHFEHLAGLTVLHLCAMFSLTDQAEILMAHGADRRALDDAGRSPQDVDSEYAIRWNLLTPEAETALAEPSANALLTGEGGVSRVLLELCGAHRINEVFLPANWLGREKEGIALWNTLRKALPPNFKEHFSDCVDLTPLRRNMQPAHENTAVGRYLASEKPPGAARGGAA